MDPDVVAAMDEDFDFDDPNNVLEDDFVQLAEGVAPDDEFNEIYEVDSNAGSEHGYDSANRFCVNLNFVWSILDLIN